MSRKIMYMDEEYAGINVASINSVNLIGNKTSDDIGVLDATEPKLNLTSFAGTSSTAQGTTTKVVTTKTGGLTLASGRYVAVRFTNATTVNTSLNVDGTGSKYAYYNGSRLNSSNGAWAAGDTVLFMYDGTYWQRKVVDDTIPADARIAYYNMALGWDDCLA